MSDNTIEVKGRLSAVETGYNHILEKPYVAFEVCTDDLVQHDFVGDEVCVTLTRIEPEPLPCPHCGGQAHVITEEHGLDIDVYLVWCDSGTCGAKGPTMCTPMKAIERWNRRA